MVKRKKRKAVLKDGLPDHDTCCVCLKELPKKFFKLKDGTAVLVLSPDQVTRIGSLLNRHSRDDCSPGGRLYIKHFDRLKEFARVATMRVNGGMEKEDELTKPKLLKRRKKRRKLLVKSKPEPEDKVLLKRRKKL